VEAANLWIQFGMLVVTAGAGSIAWWQANVAHASRALAEKAEANAVAAEARAVLAAEQSANAATESAGHLGRSAEAAERSLPPTWSALHRGDRSKYYIENTSSRHLIITAVNAEPAEYAGLLTFPHALPLRVEYGDMIDLSIVRLNGPEGIAKILIDWNYEEESVGHRTERIV
jgi:hypothetical protein